MVTKKLKILSAIAILGLLFSACGRTGQTTTTNDRKSREQVSLVVWVPAEEQSLFRSLADEFAATHAGEAELTITVEACSMQDAPQAVLSDAQNAADVFLFLDEQLPALIEGNALQPVTDSENINTEEIRSRNATCAVQAAAPEGELVAFPAAVANVSVLFYDRSVIDAEDAQTVDSLIAAASDAGRVLSVQLDSGRYLHSFFTGAGLTLGLSADGATQCDWDCEKGVRITQTLMDLAQKDGFAVLQDADLAAGILDGSVAAGICGVWNAELAQETWAGDFGVTVLPTYTLDGEQVQLASFSDTQLFGVNAASRASDWAMRLAQELSGSDAQLRRALAYGHCPSDKTAASAQALKDANPIAAAQAAQAVWAIPERVGENYWPAIKSFGSALAGGGSAEAEASTLLSETVKAITAP